jgi:hypothetical protein
MIINPHHTGALLAEKGYFAIAPANDNYPVIFFDEDFWSDDWGGAAGP